MNPNLVSRAKEFANFCHNCQHRKYTGEPYIVHPKAVVEIVESVPHTDEMLCAAWLHDVVEDAGIPERVIAHLFGDGVSLLVNRLTVSNEVPRNRSQRHGETQLRMMNAWPEAKTIKIADIIDNCRTIVERDPEFARVYLEEKAQLLEVLQGGDPTLLVRAWEIVHRGLGALSRQL